MSGFKLIAIRPLKGCSKRFLKVLKENEVYKFYNDYDFKFIDNDKTKSVISIEYNPTVPESLYNINTANGDNLNINISAIVGKNGSGKSSLIELFFAFIYNLSINTGILKEVENKDGFIEDLEQINNLFVEIYYSISGNIFCLRLDTGEGYKFSVLEFQDENSLRYFKIKRILKDELFHIRKLFFYTIAVNYSLYGLNSEQMGIWIKSLFHKNDGYQTPVVINPFREEGNIDINKELYLAKQRLLSNILKPLDEEKNDEHHFLTEIQKVESLTFTINKSKIEYAFKKGIKGETIVTFKEFFKTDKKEDILNSIYSVFLKDKRPKENVKFKEEIEIYIIKKIIKIARTYKEYKDFFKDDLLHSIGKPGSTENQIIKYTSHFIGLDAYLELLNNDRSHLTFKLRQALNYLMKDILKGNLNEGFNWEIKLDEDDDEIDVLNVSIENLSKKIEGVTTDQTKVIEFIPPSLFDIELHLISNNKSKSLFSELSSGEQQLIHSIQSIIYHAINLDSVFSGSNLTDEKHTYRYLNLILDEIELYFHPEFQRKFVNQLIGSIQRVKLSTIKNINIVLSTHSPFILSDIPSSNILQLRNGEPFYDRENKQTFGANIHNLLANDFYLGNSFMGDFAKGKINEVIKFINSKLRYVDILDKIIPGLEEKLNSISNKKNANDIRQRIESLNIELKDLEELDFKENKTSCFNIIQIIGEAALKQKLESMYFMAFPEDKEEQSFEKELVLLKKKYNK